MCIYVNFSHINISKVNVSLNRYLNLHCRINWLVQNHINIVDKINDISMLNRVLKLHTASSSFVRIVSLLTRQMDGRKGKQMSDKDTIICCYRKHESKSWWINGLSCPINHKITCSWIYFSSEIDNFHYLNGISIVVYPEHKTYINQMLTCISISCLFNIYTCASIWKYSNTIYFPHIKLKCIIMHSNRYYLKRNDRQ